MTMEQEIASLLDSLKDPFLGLNGKEMNLQYYFDKKSQVLSLVSGFPSDLLEKHFKPLAQARLQNQFPHHPLNVQIQSFITAHPTQLAGKGLRGVKNIIAIASGKGGVGKSTVSVNLAVALALCGARVGILDADIYGPSIPLMLGENSPVALQGDLYLPVQAHGIQAMSIAYLTKGEQALIWRGPMLAKSLIQMINITLWDDLDYLFIDLPPGTGDIQLTLVQKIPLTAAIVVTTPQNVATLDAQKAITLFEKTKVRVLGVVENMSTHLCKQCGHQEDIFGQGGAAALCETHDTLLLGQLPLDIRLRQQCDLGTPLVNLTGDELSQAFLKIALRSAIALTKDPLH